MFIVAREDKGAVQFENHPRHRFEQRGRIFPNDGEDGSLWVGEEVDVEVAHGR